MRTRLLPHVSSAFHYNYQGRHNPHLLVSSKFGSGPCGPSVHPYLRPSSSLTGTAPGGGGGGDERNHNPQRRLITSASNRTTANSATRRKRSTLSAPRAARAVSLLPSYLADARAVQTYCPETAPEGALQLSVAENQMLQDLLIPSLQDMYRHQPFVADAIYYQPTHGRPALRQAMADYLHQILELPPSRSIDPEGIVIGAGCNAVLENLCLCLAEQGDGVLIPTPYYAAFAFDLGARANLQLCPVTTMAYQDWEETNHNTIPEEAYYPNRASMDAALEKSLQQGIPPRIFLLSHPQNPLGICYPPHVVQEIIDWCREHEIHLVSDEIYGGSIYRPDESGFVSALALASSSNSPSSTSTGLGLGPYVHLVYSLSKDFALSGMRVGALYSENEDIRLPLQKLNDLCSVSSQTQLLVEQMLTAKDNHNDNNNDDDDEQQRQWTTAFLEENHCRLRQRGDQWHACLDELDIPYLRATAGLFVWMDLSKFLPLAIQDGGGDIDEQERSLYLELVKEHGLLFTPGRSMENELPGFFRCVFTAASDEEFNLGMTRLRRFVQSKRA